ncbi:MAG: efflux RND transporter periplasmic adaptor subunit [Proteobacteria bacterium]|nr:efflux RND transporter periplasmic adaptor subunit [Pseudomonadota bacterium]
MKLNLTAVTIVIPLVFLSFLTLSSCEKEKEAPVKKTVRPVKVRVIGEGKITQGNNSFSGTAKGIREALLSFRVPGVLRSLPYKVGQKVKGGSIGAKLDKNDFQLSINTLENQIDGAKARLQQMQSGSRSEDIAILESKIASARASVRSSEAAYKSGISNEKSAKSGLELATTENKRINILYSKQASSKGDVDRAQSNMDLKKSQWEQAKNQIEQLKNQLEQAKLNVKTGEKELEKAKAGGRKEEVQAQESEIKALSANLNMAKSNLQYTNLKIPFRGVISKRHVSNFEQIGAGTPIYTLVDMKEIEVQISIPDSLISNFHQGQKVRVNFLSLPKKFFTGEVNKIGISADQRTLTFPVFVKLSNPGNKVRPGMTANVTVQIAANIRSFPTIPIYTILQDKVDNTKFVWLLDESTQTVKRQEVLLGSLQAEEVEIIQGIKEGDILITAGIHKIRENMKVRLLQ